MNRSSAFVSKQIRKNFPNILGVYANGDDSVFLGDCAEGGTIDGYPACDYYAFESDPKEVIYVLGIHRKLRALVEKYGFFVECNDPGTYVAWRS